MSKETSFIFTTLAANAPVHIISKPSAGIKQLSPLILPSSLPHRERHKITEITELSAIFFSSVLYLPAALTPFAELNRIVPRILYHYDTKITHKRYWPTADVQPAISDSDYNTVIKKAAEILKKT